MFQVSPFAIKIQKELLQYFLAVGVLKKVTGFYLNRKIIIILNSLIVWFSSPKAYSEPYQTSTIEYSILRKQLIAPFKPYHTLHPLPTLQSAGHLAQAIAWKCSVKRICLNFFKIHRKHLCQSLFYNKTSCRLEALSVIKERLRLLISFVRQFDNYSAMFYSCNVLWFPFFTSKTKLKHLSFKCFILDRFSLCLIP